METWVLESNFLEVKQPVSAWLEFDSATQSYLLFHAAFLTKTKSTIQPTLAQQDGAANALSICQALWSLFYIHYSLYSHKGGLLIISPTCRLFSEWPWDVPVDPGTYGIKGTDPPCSWKPTYNLQLALHIGSSWSIDSTNYRLCRTAAFTIERKKPMDKWTHAVQTCLRVKSIFISSCLYSLWSSCL